jgi:hypothetical protein
MKKELNKDSQVLKKRNEVLKMQKKQGLKKTQRSLYSLQRLQN